MFACGWIDILASRKNDIPASGRKDVLTSGKEDILATGKKDVPVSGKKMYSPLKRKMLPFERNILYLLVCGEKDVLASGVQIIEECPSISVG